MIDGLGNNSANRIEPARTAVERSQAPARAGDSLEREQGTVAASPAAEMAAAGPPIDAERIAAIRAAIAEGRYPVDPEKIAERMIALDLPLVRSHA